MIENDFPARLQWKPDPVTLDASVAEAKEKLLQSIKRSVYVYRVDCGGCNGCEIEIFATITAAFDAERFGIKVVPSPPATIYGFACALGLLDQKLHASHHVAPAGEAALVPFPAMPYKVRTAFEREARRMSGYYYGKQIVDEFMMALIKDKNDALGAADALIERETDTRKRAVFMDLKALLLSKVVDE